MSTETHIARRFAAAAGLVLAGAVGATTLTGLAYAQDSSNGEPVAEENRERGEWMRGPGVPGLGPVLHSEAVVRDRDGEFRSVVTHNGTIEAVSDDSITVKSEDGYSRTYSIGGDTKVRVDRAQSTAADLATGRPARVIATTDSATILIGSSTAAGADEMESRRDERSQRPDAVREFLRERFGGDQGGDSAEN